MGSPLRVERTGRALADAHCKFGHHCGVLRRLDAFAGTRCENLNIVAARRHTYAFDGLGPGMLRQLEQRPVHRNHGAPAYLNMSLDGEFGTQVIVSPIGVVLASLD